jgi:hypothetical protein
VTGRRPASCVRRSSLPASDWSTFSRNCVGLPGVTGVGASKSWGKVASRNLIGSINKIIASNFSGSPSKEEKSFRRTQHKPFVEFPQKALSGGRVAG